MDNTHTNETASGGIVVSCRMNDSDPRYASRLNARLNRQEWRGVVSASAIGSRTPEQVIKAAIREYLERRDIIQAPKIAPGKASDIRAENRVTVLSRNGGILRTFVFSLKTWELDGLCKVADHDGDPIGRTTAHAVRHYLEARGIEPPNNRDRTTRISTARDLCSGPSLR